MRRGEIWRVNLEPTIGAEINKSRPVIIVGDDRIGKLPSRVVVPLTDWKDRYAFAEWMAKIEPDEKTISTKTRRRMLFKFVQFLSKDLTGRLANYPTAKCVRLKKHSPPF